MRVRTIAILRAFDPEAAAGVAARCWQIGIDLVEVPVQGEAGWRALDAVAEIAGGRLFGAGTVLTADDVERASDLDVSMIISPGVDETVISASRARGVVALPGVATATDVTAAHRFGIAACKLFPASVVGPGWIRAMHGPFPSMAFVAVGGVDERNALEFINGGAAGVAFGSSIERVLALDDPSAFVSSLHERAGGVALVAPYAPLL